jgi:magnesium chelatase family protein
VEAARERQRARFRDEPGVYCNAQMPPRLTRRYCALSAKAERTLERAVHQHGLSARAHDRILKLALSRSDLEGHSRIEDIDLHIAIDCRIIDRRGWLRANTQGPRPDAFSQLLPPDARSRHPEEP